MQAATAAHGAASMSTVNPKETIDPQPNVNKGSTADKIAMNVAVATKPASQQEGSALAADGEKNEAI